MQLSMQERSTIKRVAGALAGPAARVMLFGSRVRDDLLGGDIDLLVELPNAVTDALQLRLDLGAHLQMALGDQKIDIVLASPNGPETPVLAAARRDGVDL